MRRQSSIKECMTNLTTALATLQGYCDSIERIMAMVPGGTDPSPQVSSEIRYATAMLKDGVSREHRRLRGRIIGWERSVYSPAMHWLFVELQKVNVGHEPGAELFNALCGIRSGLNNSIELLKRSRHRIN